VSVLAEWWAEARAESASEREAVRLIAARLGESEGEARRILTQIGRVNLGGSSGGARRSAPDAPSNGAVPVAPQLDADAVRAYFRAGLASGLPRQAAVKAAGKRFGARPHDVRVLVAGVRDRDATGGADRATCDYQQHKGEMPR
jgi:hypothetical protein